MGNNNRTSPRCRYEESIKAFRTRLAYNSHAVDASFFWKAFSKVLPSSLGHTTPCWKEGFHFGIAGLCLSYLCSLGPRVGGRIQSALGEQLPSGPKLAPAGPYVAVEWGSGWKESAQKARDVGGFKSTQIESENSYLAIYSRPWFCHLENGNRNRYFLR